MPTTINISCPYYIFTPYWLHFGRTGNNYSTNFTGYLSALASVLKSPYSHIKPSITNNLPTLPNTFRFVLLTKTWSPNLAYPSTIHPAARDMDEEFSDFLPQRSGIPFPAKSAPPPLSKYSVNNLKPISSLILSPNYPSILLAAFLVYYLCFPLIFEFWIPETVVG